MTLSYDDAIEMKNGRPVSAQIYDFKTDRDGADLQIRHRDQLETYRRAAAKLLDLPLSEVSAEAVGVLQFPER